MQKTNNEITMSQEKISQVRIAKKKELLTNILDSVKREIYLKYKFFGLAISSIDILPNVEIETLGIKASMILYNEDYILNAFKNSEWVSAKFMHSLFHVIFKHSIKGVRKEKAKLWNLACDIVVGNLLDNEGILFSNNIAKQGREKFYKEITKYTQISSAEKVALYLETLNNQLIAKLIDSFKVDNHAEWHILNDEQDENEIELAIEKINDLSSVANTQIECYSDDGKYNEIKKILNKVNRSKQDYKQFLNSLLSLRENIKINNDEFDYAYYSYGMQIYKNMPLIEPLEYSEDKSLKDVIIIIDTSGSTKGELVEKFLYKTQDIITEYAGNTEKIGVRILQADDEVRSDRCINNKQDLDGYCQNLSLIGGGGTDFTKAFEYLQNDKRDVKAVLYFTDGYGKYPSLSPDYPVAFIFIENQENNYNIPAWAIKLVLDSEEI